MATFVWPAEVQWPPPAHILLNYDVVPPDAVTIEAQGEQDASGAVKQDASGAVLRSADVQPDTHGGIRFVDVTPAPPATSKESPMTVGDRSANSYGWNAKLTEAVPDGASATIPTPGFDEQYTDVRYAEVAVEGVQDVMRTGEGKTTIAFVTSEPYSATVTNSTGAEWPAGAGVYLFCPHLLSEGHNQYDLKGQVWDLQQRVIALEEAAGLSSNTKGKEKDKAKEPPEPSSKGHPEPKAHEANHKPKGR